MGCYQRRQFITRMRSFTLLCVSEVLWMHKCKQSQSLIATPHQSTDLLWLLNHQIERPQKNRHFRYQWMGGRDTTFMDEMAASKILGRAQMNNFKTETFAWKKLIDRDVGSRSQILFIQVRQLRVGIRSSSNDHKYLFNKKFQYLVSERTCNSFKFQPTTITKTTWPIQEDKVT